MRCIFHIDLDAFFVSVEQVHNPSLRGRPVVVGGPARRGVVASASYEARAFGVKSGISLSQAKRLCPQAIFIEGRWERYQAASQHFFSILVGFSPFLEPGGNDEGFLDMTGFEGLYGPAREAARRLKERVRRELGLTASVGIASNKLVAKVASDLEKPDGLVEVPAGEEVAFLDPLAISRLPGVGPRTEKVLRGIGVVTLGQLAALSPSLMRFLLGKPGEMLWRYAQGWDDSPVEWPPAAKSVSRSTTFAVDTLDRTWLLATLYYLSEGVGAELRRLGKVARVVHVQVRYSDFETRQRQSRLPQPSDAHQSLFQAGVSLLESLLMPGCRLVRLVGIGASGLVAAQQLSLWPCHQERLACLNRAIDRLRWRYGFTAVESGWTFHLRQSLTAEEGGYQLSTPCLSRPVF